MGGGGAPEPQEHPGLVNVTPITAGDVRVAVMH